MRSESEIRSAVRAFVRQRSPGLPIHDDTPLLRQRVLRSIHLPELIILLERLRGAPVDVERLAHGDFDSIDAIVERFATVP